MCIKRIDSLLAPVRRLPRDILIDIFTLCLPSRWSDVDGFPNPGFMEACYYWRTVCLEFSPFWSTTVIKTAVKSAIKLKRLNARMERSGSAPLNIRVECVDDSIPVFDSLASHSHRLKEFHLASPYLSSQQSCKMVGSFPMLEVLSLGDANRQEWSGLYKWRFDVFVEAPRLRQVSLVNPLNSSRISLPWAQLIHITVNYFTENDCVQVLRLCPNLVKCHLENVRASFQLPDSEESSPAVPQYVLLGRLTDLAISTRKQEPGRCLTQIFNSITVPTLQTLTITCPPEWFPQGLTWPQPGILGILKRSKCFVKNLTINSGYFTAQHRSQIEQVNTFNSVYQG